MAKSNVIRARNGVIFKTPPSYDYPAVEVTIDLDDPAVDSAASKMGGEELLRVVVVKKGKRQILWVHLKVPHNGKAPYLAVTAGGRGSDVRKEVAIRPWLPVEKNKDGEWEPTAPGER